MGCQYIFSSSKTFCGTKTEKGSTYCNGHQEGIIRTREAFQPIVDMAQKMNAQEAYIFRDWVVDSLRTLGLDHAKTCNLNIPHSHSADCSCGADELTEKIMFALERPTSFAADGLPHSA